MIPSATRQLQRIMLLRRVADSLPEEAVIIPPPLYIRGQFTYREHIFSAGVALISSYLSVAEQNEIRSHFGIDSQYPIYPIPNQYGWVMMGNSRVIAMSTDLHELEVDCGSGIIYKVEPYTTSRGHSVYVAHSIGENPNIRVDLYDSIEPY